MEKNNQNSIDAVDWKFINYDLNILKALCKDLKKKKKNSEEKIKKIKKEGTYSKEELNIKKKNYKKRAYIGNLLFEDSDKIIKKYKEINKKYKNNSLVREEFNDFRYDLKNIIKKLKNFSYE